MYEIISPYLTKEAVKELKKNGKYVWRDEFGWVTPTLPSDKEICVYGLREKNGTIHCAFEKAYVEKKIDWGKPVSCHLYPIIADQSEYATTERINYEPQPKVCLPAGQLGKKLKEPIVRKWGLPFWKTLNKLAKGEWKQKE